MGEIVGIESLASEIYIADENHNIIYSSVKKESVKHPNHYLRDGLPECKEIIEKILEGYSEFLSEKEIFWLGNVIKYIYRAPLKNKREDLEKAAEYLCWIINEK